MLFSQKIILNNGDTLIGLTRNQSKFLIESYYKMKKSDTLLSLCESKCSLKDSIILRSEKIIIEKDTVVSSFKSLFILKESELFESKERNAQLTKKLNRNRTLATVFLGTTLIAILIILL